MPRPLSWRQLLPGLAVTAALALAIGGVLRFARVGALRGDTLFVFAITENASGIVEGSEVWLGGQRIGRVRGVGLAPPTADTVPRVVITAEILAEHRDVLRRDSRADIRSSGTVVGARVLNLSVGTPAAPVIEDGDTIRARDAGDVEGVTGRAALASREFPAIIVNVKELASQLGSTTSTVGAIITSDDAAEAFGALSQRAARLGTQLTRGQGVVGQVLGRRGTALARAQHAAAELDTLSMLLESKSPRLGGFNRDSTLAASVQNLRSEIAIVRALLDEPRGTAGRVLHDEAIQRELAAADAELGALIDDIKARPLRYIAF